jgi:hypothetical protein
MGGLFNTQNTMKLLSALNSIFQETAFTNASNNPTLIKALGSPHTKVASKVFAKNYGLNLGNNSYDPKWYQWLDIFDKNGGDAARADMVTALTHTTTPDANGITYSGIEFFAVPAAKFSVLPTSTLSDQENTGKSTLIVTVETPIFDVLFEQLQERRKSRSKTRAVKKAKK